MNSVHNPLKAGKKPGLILLPALLFGLALPAGLSAKTLYVSSPAAKLHSSASSSSPALLSRMRRGTSLRQIGRKGLYYKVRVRGKVGYVSRLYVSKYRPGKKVGFSRKGFSRGAAARARVRVSASSETAAARGHKKSESLRTRGKANLYDFVSVQWLERQGVGDADLKKFAGSGNLKWVAGQ